MTLRWNWGVGMALLYALFASATVGFVVFALANPAALVTEHYYEDATRQDQRIEATANARAAGADLVLDADADDCHCAVFHIARPEARAAVGTVTWYRASDASYDRTGPLALDADGVQRIPLDDVPSGSWKVQVEWEAEGRPFYFERAVMVRP